MDLLTVAGKLPLKRRKPHELHVAHIEPDDDTEVFQVRVTGEVFQNYSDYIDQVLQYQQRIWSSAISGKINLTFEEAVMQDVAESRKVEDLPDVLIGLFPTHFHFLS